MIPIEKWKWFGRPLHFCAAKNCEYHLGTQVGKYLISSVGGLRYGDLEDYQEIGLNRYYETFVFLAGKERPCGCPQIDGMEIDCVGFDKEALCKEIDQAHFDMCIKYAQKEDSE